MEEYQRYGRNKDTVINSTYINSGVYRRKFDKITHNDDINHILYLKAKEMLFHRSGTLYEDMYWIDGNTGEIVAKALDEKEEKKVEYSAYILKAIKDRNNLITIHTHPNSMPPSIADFNSCFLHNYAACFVICHNGVIYSYTSSQKVPDRLYRLYINNYKNDAYINSAEIEREAQFEALKQIRRSYKIDFVEVIWW